MGEAADLEKDGVERHLQEALADAPRFCGEGFRLVRREWPTEIGPVDLMCRDEDDEWIAVEIKRVATIDAVEQLTRYLELIRRDPAMGECRGVLAAQQVKPQARTLAESREIDCVEIDLAVLRGEREPDLTLFALSRASGVRQRGDERLDLRRLAQRRTVAEQHELRRELGQPSLAAAVERRVVGERPGRLVQAVPRREDVHVEEDVAADQRAVRLAPEREMAGAVAGRLEHEEAGADLVALAQLAVGLDLRRPPTPTRSTRRRARSAPAAPCPSAAPRHRRAPTQTGTPSVSLTCLDAAGVIDVDVRQRVCRDAAAGDGAHDLAAVERSCPRRSARPPRGRR